MMVNSTELIQLIITCGAYKADIIKIEDIVLNRDFAKMCEDNKCGIYGKCYMCPPSIGKIDELISKVGTFSGGIIYQTVSEKDNPFSPEKMRQKVRDHMSVSQIIQRRIKTDCDIDFLHLSTGGCCLCDTCAKVTDEPCRFPNDALSSLEAYGIDVFKTLSATSIKDRYGQDTITFFGIILSNDINL